MLQGKSIFQFDKLSDKQLQTNVSSSEIWGTVPKTATLESILKNK